MELSSTQLEIFHKNIKKMNCSLFEYFTGRVRNRYSFCIVFNLRIQQRGTLCPISVVHVKVRSIYILRF